MAETQPNRKPRSHLTLATPPAARRGSRLEVAPLSFSIGMLPLQLEGELAQIMVLRRVRCRSWMLVQASLSASCDNYNRTLAIQRDWCDRPSPCSVCAAPGQPPGAIRRLPMSSLKNTAMLAAACLVVAAADSSQAWAGVATELESVGPLGVLPNNISEEPSLSADGRFVAFSSLATNLVAGDTNGKRDVFVRDRMTQTTTRVSLGSCQYRGGCAQSNDDSNHPRISADGRFVAFESYAGNLVAGNGGINIKRRNVFIRDRLTGTTKQVSVGSSGVQGNNDSWWPSLSADGRFVAFTSKASNLVPDDTNN